MGQVVLSRYNSYPQNRIKLKCKTLPVGVLVFISSFMSTRDCLFVMGLLRKKLREDMKGNKLLLEKQKRSFAIDVT